MAAKVYKPEYPGLYYFDTFTFTTLGTSGHRGPDPTKGYANAPWNPDQFSIVDGQQQWTVPATGTYRIEAAGAYGAAPGRVVSGDIDLSEGQTLTMLVGQQPTPLVANVADNVTVGGGGGTFVVSDGKPLIVASGGDGGVYSTGYLRSELATENFQFRVSMSADGNLYAAIEISLITYQATLKIYRYLSGVWTSEFTAPSVFSPVVGLSGNGKTIAIPTSNSIAVYEYVEQVWENPRYITNNEWNYVSCLQISYDGNTIVAFTSNIISNIYFHLYVCTKNQDLTWNTEELSAPGIDTFTVYQSSSCAISGDGTRIFAAADDIYSYPTVSNLWSYSRTNNTWGLPELYTSLGVLRVESTSVSYDGQIVAIYAGNLQTDPREGYLYMYENGVLTRNLMFPWTVNQYPAGAVQISYDGSLALLIFITGKILVTPSTQITIFDDASGFPLPSGCIDSTASRIVSPYYDVANPITYFFEAGGSGQPGSFLPSGTGSGISGAGYLTDGQQTDPFFGFLKPKAYVNGGFGNSYEYGQPGVPKEGGFGGGQSPLNKQTDLTSVSGYNQFRPTIPLVTGALTGMAISDDANTFLASFFVGNSNYTNVYAYNGTSWVSTNLYTTTTGGGKSLAMSGDGIVWLIDGDVWRNGSFEIHLQDFAQLGVGYNVTDISRDGNTAVIMYGQSGGGGYYDTTVRLIVYSYSGSWTSSTLFSENPTPDFAIYTCVMSADGNTIAMSYTVPTYVFVNVYRRVDGTWSGPDQIFYQTLTSRNLITLNINSDGSIITLSAGSSRNYQYSNGVLSKVDYGTYSGAFSRTDPNLYAWSNFSTVYVPSISLEVVVQVDPAGIGLMKMGSNVLAMTKTLTPHAIVFLDMYNPTTTCTATTSVAHGYPYDYEVQITGTQYFNGTWLIAAGTSNTFTFQAFGGPTVTSGYVSGTTTGISGGGGYTGSAGNGVSGATCYADESVAKFTDLGAASNSAGYVTVTLMDPVPVKQKVALNPWAIQPTVFAPVTTWSAVAYGNGIYVSMSNNGTYPVMYSRNGVEWSTNTSGSKTDSWISVTFGNGLFSAVSTTGSIAYSYDGIHWVVIQSVLYNIVPGAGFDFFGTSMDMSSDGTILAVNLGPSNFNLPRLVQIYENGVLSYTLTGNPGDAFGGAVALSADGTIVAVGVSGVSSVKVYTNGVLAYTLTGNDDYFGQAVALSADGTILAVGTPNASYVKVYTNGNLTYTLTGNDDYFGRAVALSADGTILAVGAPGANYVNVYINGSLSYQTNEFDAGYGNGKYLDLNSDGTILAVCTNNYYDNYNSIVHIYNNGNIIYNFVVSTSNPYGPYATVSLNSDGTILAVGIPGAYPVNGIVAVYKNGDLLNTIEDKTSTEFGTAVVLSSDGNIFAGSNGLTFNYETLYVKVFDTFFNSVSPLSSVTYGNGTFVAISNVSSTIYSTDSINWSSTNALFDTWSSVTYGNGQFVAVSNYGTTSNVMYSLDGNIWSNVTTGTTSNSWNSVSYGNDRFLAISSNATSMYSLNGIDWVDGGSPGVSSNCIAFGDGYFVCPSSNSSVSAVSISTNGQSWQELSLTYTPGVYAGITYGTNGFIAVSSTGLLLGFAPTFWVNTTQVNNSVKLNSVNWSGLAYGNGSFVAVGQGLIQTSLDYGNTWSSFAVSNTFTSVAYSSNLGKFLALPGFFGDGLYTSTDSSNWTLSQTLPPSVPSAPTSLTYGNGKFVATLYGDSNVFYSRDGLNWSLAQSQLAAQWSSITYGNGKFLAVSNSFSSFETMYSNDGITWTLNTSFRYTVIGAPSALSSGGTILAVASEGSIAATNGVLAYTIANISGDGTYLHRVALNATGTILAIGSSLAVPNGRGNTRVYTNGVLSYTLTGNNNNDEFGYAVALSADGTILAVSAPQTFATQPGFVKVYTNGVLSYTLTGNNNNDQFGYAVALSADGTIVAVGATAGNYVKVYTNGVLSYTLTGNDDYFGQAVALSADGTILAAGATTGNYVKVYTNGVLSYTLVGNPGDLFGSSLALSANGTILAVGAPNASSYAGYVKVYTNQILTALFSGTAPEQLGISVALSSNGNIFSVSYIDLTGPKTKIYDLNLYKKRGLSSVTYGNGLFVAVTNPGGSIYSTDGINWLSGNAPIDTWTSVSYGDGFFIAVSDDGTYPVMYSQDGINWSTTDPGSQLNNWGSVAFGGDMFLAIPTSGATTMTTTVSKTF